MGNADKTHFASYRLQTRTKHAILDGYLRAYFNVIKTRQDNLVFIDGFAGPGSYTSGTESFDGSPIRALKLVSSQKDLADRVLCIFIEKDKAHYDELVGRVDSFAGAHSIKRPIVANGAFTYAIDDLLKSVAARKGLAPTFLFVDPCGVDDVSMKHIAGILSRDYCEVFIFFNYDGINRIAGFAEKRDGTSDTLTGLYGSEAAAAAMVKEVGAASTPEEREQVIVQHYKEALARESKAKFIIPLRIEKEDSRSTSHYLLHATKHQLGFRIMKDVMWKASGKIECEGNTLALLQASKKSGGSLFRHPELLKLSESILGALEGGPRTVRYFLKDLVDRPTDMFAESVYRQELLRLEAAGEVETLEADGKTPCPAESRPFRKGRPTLSKDRGFLVRLVGGNE